MTELDPLAYLSRWSAARLVAWYVRPPQKWSSRWSIAIGAVIGWLRNGRTLTPKLQNECDKARAQLAMLMLGPICLDCGEP